MSDGRCLFDQLQHFAQHRPERQALIGGGRRVSYLQLQQRAQRVASGLASLDLPAHCRIAILSRNIPEFFEIWCGAAMAGHVLTPINARLAPGEVAFIVKDSGAGAIFVDQPYHALVGEIGNSLNGVRQVISLAGSSQWPHYPDWRDAYTAADPQPGKPDDTVVQMYTSGTTGFPKGVELDHGSVLACVRSMMGLNRWGDAEVALVTAPLFHTAGSAWAHCALQSGGTVVLLEELSPDTVLWALEDHAVSQALLVPTLIRMVQESPHCQQADFSRLKRILYGASPISVAVLERAIEVFCCEFEQGYGLTETVGPVAMLRPADHLVGGPILKSCGKAVAGVEIRVVDSAGVSCRNGEVGEIVVAGAQVMKGYWQRPDATREAIRDGWLHTGDAGYFDDEGYLYIHDRLKDMIISGGENVYPAEVESALAGLQGILDAAVIGVPDERWGEAVKALVVRRQDATVSEQDVIGHARAHIAAYKCPKSVEFVDSIPRNVSGKILKRVLREPYWQGHQRKVS